LGTIVRFCEKIDTFCFTIGMVCTVIMMLLVSTDVIGRSFFNYPIYGTFEITQDFLITALFFTSISYAYREGAHIRVTMFIRFIPAGLVRLAYKFLEIATFFFFFIMGLSGWKLFTHALEVNDFSPGVLQYPLAPSYFFIPLGATLICIRLLLSIFNLSKNKI